MKTEVWTIYNKFHTPSEWKFFKTRKECKAEIDRIFNGMDSFKKVANIKPTKVTIEFHL